MQTNVIDLIHKTCDALYSHILGFELAGGIVQPKTKTIIDEVYALEDKADEPGADVEAIYDEIMDSLDDIYLSTQPSDDEPITMPEWAAPNA